MIPNEEDDEEDVPQNRKPYPAILASLGIVLLVIGAVAPSSLDWAVDAAVWDQTRLDSNVTKSFPGFATGGEEVHDGEDEVEDSLLLRFYMFDVLNADEITRNLAIDNSERLDAPPLPKVREMGPYVYRVKLKHLNVTWYELERAEGEKESEEEGFIEKWSERTCRQEDETELYYKPWQIVTRAEDGVGRDDSELVTTVDIPNQIVETLVKLLLREESPFVREWVMRALSERHRSRRERVFTRRSVHDHLFGYVDEDFRFAMKTLREALATFSGPIANRLHSLLAGSSARSGGGRRTSFLNLLSPMHYPGFVANYTSPAEVDAKLRFDAIRVDRQMHHQYYWWQGDTQLKIWETREANRVGGSDGKLFRLFRNREAFKVWLPEIIRKVELVGGGRHDTVRAGGIECRRLHLAPWTFVNESGYHAAQHLPPGLLNLSSLLLGVPVFVSKPRFLDASPSLARAVQGLDPPDRALHDVTFDVHRETGLSVVVAERFQYNLYLPMRTTAAVRRGGEVNNNDMARRREDGDGVYLPMFWMETIETMSNKHRRLFKRCDSFVRGARLLKSLGVAFGILGLASGITLATFRQERDAKRSQREKIAATKASRGERENGASTWSVEARGAYDVEGEEANGVVDRLSQDEEVVEEEDEDGASPRGENDDDHRLDDGGLSSSAGTSLLLRSSRPRHASSRSRYTGLLARKLRWIWSAPSIRRAWCTTPIVMFCVNVVIEIAQLSRVKQVHVWENYKGATSVSLQMILTALMVGLFACITAVAVARASFVRGELPNAFPGHRASERLGFPFSVANHACKMGLVVGAFFVIVFAGPVLLATFVFACRESPAPDEEIRRGHGACVWNWLFFTMFKAIFAAVEGFVVFPFAAMRALECDL